MAREVESNIIGPMPVETFLDEFVRSEKGLKLACSDQYPASFFDTVPTTATDTQRNSWKSARKTRQAKFKKCGKEKGMAEPWARRLNTLMPQYKSVNSSDSPDAQSDWDKKWRPDVSTYKKPEKGSYGASKILKGFKETQLDRVELVTEIKTTKNAVQAFQDAVHKNANPKEHEFLLDGKGAELLRGKVATMATEVLNRQHRTCFFMVLITDPHARLIRVDRAGIVVSAAIQFRIDPLPLIDFFLHFNNLSREGRGLDPTVRDPTLKEQAIAHEKLSAPKDGRGVKVIAVPGNGQGESSREVLAYRPMVDAASLTGRCTRTYKVWDLKDNVFRFLKDTWRPDTEDSEKESAVLRELKEHGVPHIPDLICGDDIEGNVTRTQDFLDAPWVGARKRKPIDPRVNHRLLENLVPRFLEDCKNIRGVFQVIYDALVAHQKAYECGWLHRDISDNNVLVLEFEDRGVLADWELAIRVKDRNDEPVDRSKRPHYRTGTWDFMSIKLLSSLDAAHTVLDDLESFFWLVLHVSIRVVPIQSRLADVNTIMKDLFHASSWDSNTRSFFGGGYKEHCLLIDGGSTSFSNLTFPGNKALDSWYKKVRLALRASFTRSASSEEQSGFNHDFLAQQFTTALESTEWSKEPLMGSESRVVVKAKGGPTTAARGAGKRDLATMQGSDDDVAQHGEEDDDENQGGDGDCDGDAEEGQGEADDDEGEDEEAEDEEAEGMDESEGEGPEDEDEGADGSGEPPMKSLRLDAQGTRRSTRRTA
ncbi:other/FunK1 protein kinase [Coprinopsis cinerea AmutBmut pab1-1]|nr:other/FunK1 protein kinase [Coprinopsis cinerea AmutBmut pab1-1]